MASARHGNDTYTVKLASTAAERAAAYALRAVTYEEKQRYLLGGSGPGALCAADVYDDRSYVFACERAGVVVGTCRFTPPLGGRYELDDLVATWTRPPVRPASLVETSRVVIGKSERATGLVEAMLLLAGTWLLERTPYRYNFAVCVRPLVRIYARLGMKLIAPEELTLRGRPGDRKYVVIYGDMEAEQPAVVARLEARGWQLDLGPRLVAPIADEPRQRKAGS
ncbi:MAG: hypothetical protein JWM74_3874 [Myxococcaceae bacterium]|nr:hypothetical protein [Myxococcaceae bacterium]